MTNERSLAADMLDPDTQARAALEFSRLAPSNEAATWAIAAAVFSLRDTVAEAMNAKAAASAAAEPDPSRLTPEEAAAIRRWTVYPHGPFPFTRTDMGFADQALADEVRRTQDALNCARDLMNRDPASQAPLGGRVGSQAPRPAVTRQQVRGAIAGVMGGNCLQNKGQCLPSFGCVCAKQINAVMKLLEGGE